MDKCWMCDSEDIAYIDVLDMAWCNKHFDEEYLGQVIEAGTCECSEECGRSDSGD